MMFIDDITSSLVFAVAAVITDEDELVMVRD
jgi:hypothetical protein